MAYTDKQKAYKYINDYQKEKYDRTTLLFPKGDKEKIQKIADKQHLKINDYIKQLVYRELEGQDAHIEKPSNSPQVELKPTNSTIEPIDQLLAEKPEYTNTFGEPITKEEYDAVNDIFGDSSRISEE